MTDQEFYNDKLRETIATASDMLIVTAVRLRKIDIGKDRNSAAQDAMCELSNLHQNIRYDLLIKYGSK